MHMSILVLLDNLVSFLVKILLHFNITFYIKKFTTALDQICYIFRHSYKTPPLLRECNCICN